jgi:hypothetical protein
MICTGRWFGYVKTFVCPSLMFETSVGRNVFEDCWSVLRTAIEESVGPGPREQVSQV